MGSALRFIGPWPGLVIYTDRLPETAGGCANGPVARIRPKYRDDAGLHAHEQEHVRQWYVGLLLGGAAALLLGLAAPEFATFCPAVGLAGVALHPLAYLAIPRYRLWAEARAYRIQARHYPDDRTALFASFLATRYKLAISEAEARSAIRGEGK